MNVILSPSLRSRIAKNLLLVSALLYVPLALAAGSAEKGKTAYVKHGCWQCHGFVGQGGVTGPKLAPNPIPPEAFSAFVRFSAGGMPPYQKAILSAFADVEQALAGTSRLGQQENLQADVQARARESLRLAEIRYRAGADDLLTVLDAQRTLFAAQDQLAQIELSRLQAAVSLYKALGGGWSGPGTVAAAPPA